MRGVLTGLASRRLADVAGNTPLAIPDWAERVATVRDRR